ncbi:sugar ABC transporter permease (plasmid) [Deinococcus taeanensis]|uniref:carbohydrate ABC transporter permease n=1 Tax=Deinococcus taeanensis TaxID=2737050 RepID=UPI001CDB7E75|nr:sugar ABC transporter permease [Deinococcus taeanensis]UBV44902.1 sugar ABC transporter permease [Deinococcus taeanensis]
MTTPVPLRSSPPPGPAGPGRAAHARQRALTAAALVVPFAALYVLFLLYPTLRVLQLSFTDADLTGAGRWTGTHNYARLLSEPTFWTALWNTVLFIVLTAVPNTLIGLGLAMLVLRLRRLKNVVLAAFFLPYVLPVSVVTNVWNWVLDSNFGLFNFVTGSTVTWFQDPVWALPSVAFVTIWWTVGFNILLFIAGLSNISPEIYEAAALDGASGWRLFRSITWPNLWPVTSLILLLQLIAQFKIFDQIYLLTQGGPFDKTLVLLLYAYREGFQQQHGGYASALGVVLMLAIGLVSAVQLALSQRGGRS